MKISPKRFIEKLQIIKSKIKELKLEYHPTAI